MLSVRAMQPADTHRVADYFCRNSPDFYSRLGINPTKVPSAELYQAHLVSLIDLSPAEATAFYSIWLQDGEPIGHACLKDIVYGKFGSQHLHIWKPLERGKGSGATLFCLSAIDFFVRFRCEKIICEPRTSNPLPNRMLQRVGFKLLGSRVAASSEISEVCEISTYQIERAVAEEYLAAHPATP